MEYKIYFFIIKIFTKPLINSNIKILYYFWRVIKFLINFLFKVDIDPNAKMWKNIIFTHFIWIVIWPSCIWDNCIIRQNVTIWRKTLIDKLYPIIGNNV
jgi:serine acetyltransferase